MGYIEKGTHERRLKKYKQFAKPKKLTTFIQGQKVLVQTDVILDKQDPKYLSGGIVKRILGNDTYEIILNGRIQKRYAAQLRGY